MNKTQISNVAASSENTPVKLHQSLVEDCICLSYSRTWDTDFKLHRQCYYFQRHLIKKKQVKLSLDISICFITLSFFVRVLLQLEVLDFGFLFSALYWRAKYKARGFVFNMLYIRWKSLRGK